MNNKYVLLSNGGFASIDELYHHGILGMKWGVRRYQNKDGTLTAAGKNRVRAQSGKVGFPDKVSKHTANRNALLNTSDSTANDEYLKVYKNEENKLLSDIDALTDYGYILADNPDSDVREHNRDLLDALVSSSPDVMRAKQKLNEQFLDKYADATIADLGLYSTKPAKDFVKEILRENSAGFKYSDPDEYSKKVRNKIREDSIGTRMDVGDKIGNNIRYEINSRTYKTIAEKKRAIDKAFREKLREFEKIDTVVAEEIWQQWNFMHDALEL